MIDGAKFECNPESIYPLCNYVLVEIENDTIDYKKVGDVTLYFDTTYHEDQYTVRSGKVAKVCNRLDDFKGSDSIVKSDIEIEPGDEVWFTAMSYGDDSLICWDNKKYIIIRYGELYMRRRHGKIYMLNDYVLCTTIDDYEWESDVIINPDRKRQDIIAKVESVGDPKIYYTDKGPYMEDVDVGDIIMVSSSSRNLFLERDIINTLDKQYICVIRKNIIANI